MSKNTIDSKMLARMFMAGACNLEKNKDYINELNVFPVPDGDTGTNMTMTIMSAYKELNNLEDPDMRATCKAISSGSLRGARGNSGVILSQLIRGFTKIAVEYKELDIDIITDACKNSVATAYKAVMKPKEGTILTVASGVYDKAEELRKNGEKDLTVFLETVIAYADEVLLKTPELLPVLKQAGVVDSGGQGLMEFLHGALDLFEGKDVETNIVSQKAAAKAEKKETFESIADEIKYNYNTEFVIVLNKPFNAKTEQDLKNFLDALCDNINIVPEDGNIKVRCHTNDPGLIVQRALKQGVLTDIKIENLKLEAKENDASDSKNDVSPKAEVKTKIKEEPKEYVHYRRRSDNESFDGRCIKCN